MLGNVGLEGRVAALVGDDLRVVEPDGGAVRRGLEMQDHTATVPTAGNPHGRLIPDVAEVVAYRGVSGDVIETGRYGHLPGVGERAAEPSGAAAVASRVECEQPQPVEGLAFAGRAVLGSKHAERGPTPRTSRRWRRSGQTQRRRWRSVTASDYWSSARGLTTLPHRNGYRSPMTGRTILAERRQFAIGTCADRPPAPPLVPSPRMGVKARRFDDR